MQIYATLYNGAFLSYSFDYIKEAGYGSFCFEICDKLEVRRFPDRISSLSQISFKNLFVQFFVEITKNTKKIFAKKENVDSSLSQISKKKPL